MGVVAVGLALGGDAHLGPHAHAELGRRLLGVAAADLVADDAALVELDHAAAHVVDHLAVVGDDDDRRAGLVDPVEQLHHADRGDRVEVAAGLVGEQQRRVVDEGAGDRDALLLAAGELVGVAVQLGREADQAQRLRHLGADLGAAGADHLQRVGDVVVDGAVGQQLEVLEDGADVAPQLRDLLLRQGADVAAGDADRAVGGRLVADQRLDQGRLAAAGRADEEDELAAVDRQRDPVERHVAARIDLGHVAQLDDRLASRPPSLRLLAARLSLSQSGHARAPFCEYRVTPAPRRARNSAPNLS